MVIGGGEARRMEIEMVMVDRRRRRELTLIGEDWYHGTKVYHPTQRKQGWNWIS